VKLSSVTTGSQGKVDLVPPHAIHAEQGGPTRSVAMIVRSQKLGQGTVLQHTYDPKTNAVIERYGPTQIPYDLVA
jgi:predicted amidohydrolase